jgi:hypothetical protein
MKLILYLIFLVAFGFFLYKLGKRKEEELTEQYMNGIHRDLLDENGDPIKKPKVETVIGGGDSDAPIQELRYFCIKDKGYHISVWPKGQRIGDYIDFVIAGINHIADIDNYLGEFEGTLEPEPTNPYDSNAIKILAPDSHLVGYVPKDQTKDVRAFTSLPCCCYCYIGINDGHYFSCCYINNQ